MLGLKSADPRFTVGFSDASDWRIFRRRNMEIVAGNIYTARFGKFLKIHRKTII
jgi:hypothetical protein